MWLKTENLRKTTNMIVTNWIYNLFCIYQRKSKFSLIFQPSQKMNSEFHHSNLKYICYKLNLNTQKDEFLIKKYVKMWKNTWSFHSSYFCTFTFFSFICWNFNEQINHNTSFSNGIIISFISNFFTFYIDFRRNMP